jgi:hypothetical protein
MARARTETKSEARARTLRTTMKELISARIQFKVHYPSKNSMVITCESNLNNEQLRVVLDSGGQFGPSKDLIILIPDLGANDDGK